MGGKNLNLSRASQTMEHSKDLVMCVSSADVIFKCCQCNGPLLVDFSTLSAYHIRFGQSCRLNNTTIGKISFVDLVKIDFTKYSVGVLKKGVVSPYVIPGFTRSTGIVKPRSFFPLMYRVLTVCQDVNEFRYLCSPMNIVNGNFRDPEVLHSFASQFIAFYGANVATTEGLSCIDLIGRSCLNSSTSIGSLQFLSDAVEYYNQRTDLFYGDPGYDLTVIDTLRLRVIVDLLRIRIVSRSENWLNRGTFRLCHSGAVSLRCCKESKADSLCSLKLRVNDVSCLHPSLLAWSCCRCCVHEVVEYTSESVSKGDVPASFRGKVIVEKDKSAFNITDICL